MQSIAARYPGTCAACGSPFDAGAQIAHDRATRSAYHANCAHAAEEPAPVTVTLTATSPDYFPTRGTVIRDPEQTDRYLLVVRGKPRFVAEDGLSFGLDCDSGWTVELACREATAEEAAALRAEDERTQRLVAARARRRALAERIQREGERPEPPTRDLTGELILNEATIHGGGDWFVLDARGGYLWYVLNNGADGDDWSANNVRTGGAGAIGWRVRATPELVQELREIEAILDPGAVERRTSSARRVYRDHIAPHLSADQAAVWGEPEDDAALGSPPSGLLYSQITTHLSLGLAPDGAIWLQSSAPSVMEAIREQWLWGYGYSGAYVYNGVRRAIAIRYEPTPERRAAYDASLPDWLPPAVVEAWRQGESAAHALRGTRGVPADHVSIRRSADPGCQEVTAARDAAWAGMPEGLGRYQLPGSHGTAANLRDALAACSLWKIGLHVVRVEPGLELVVSAGGDQPWSLWSDGTLMLALSQSASPRRVNKQLAQIVGAALRQSEWRQDDRWRSLLEISEITDVVRLDQREQAARHSGERQTLERIECRVADGGARTLYRVRQTEWSLGEDGDASTVEAIYTALSAAEAAFARGI